MAWQDDLPFSPTAANLIEPPEVYKSPTLVTPLTLHTSHLTPYTPHTSHLPSMFKDHTRTTTEALASIKLAAGGVLLVCGCVEAVRSLLLSPSVEHPDNLRARLFRASISTGPAFTSVPVLAMLVTLASAALHFGTSRRPAVRAVFVRSGHRAFESVAGALLVVGLPVLVEHLVLGPASIFIKPLPALWRNFADLGAGLAIHIVVGVAAIVGLERRGVTVCSDVAVGLYISTMAAGFVRLGSRMSGNAAGPLWPGMCILLTMFVPAPVVGVPWLCHWGQQPDEDMEMGMQTEQAEQTEQKQAEQTEQKQEEQAEPTQKAVQCEFAAQLASQTGFLYILLSVFTLVLPFFLYCSTPNVPSTLGICPWWLITTSRTLTMAASAYVAGAWLTRAYLCRPFHPSCFDYAPYVLAACGALVIECSTNVPLGIVGLTLSSAAVFYVGVIVTLHQLTDVVA